MFLFLKLLRSQERKLSRPDLLEWTSSGTLKEGEASRPGEGVWGEEEEGKTTTPGLH